jgi:hypothetical protein
MQLDPGDGHPHAPCAIEDLAIRLGVTLVELQAWCDEGCPRLADGRCDPFAVTNWLSWGRLDRCPVLARRWRSWLRWFTTPARPCRLLVHRAQTCWLPEARHLRWLVPEPPDCPGQQVLARAWEDGEPMDGRRLIVREAAREHGWRAEDEIALTPIDQFVMNRQRDEDLMKNLADSFTYAYRRHRPDDTLGWSGTCLDLARQCGLAVAARGQAWRLVSGVVAHRGLANAHFWVEYDAGKDGWIQLDPTIPAVARMLGGDWLASVPWSVGRHDARRIRVASAEAPSGPDLGGCGGELDADGCGALYCTDWAVGACSWSVAAA